MNKKKYTGIRERENCLTLPFPHRTRIPFTQNCCERRKSSYSTGENHVDCKFNIFPFTLDNWKYRGMCESSREGRVIFRFQTIVSLIPLLFFSKTSTFTLPDKYSVTYLPNMGTKPFRVLEYTYSPKNTEHLSFYNYAHKNSSQSVKFYSGPDSLWYKWDFFFFFDISLLESRIPILSLKFRWQAIMSLQARVLKTLITHGHI